MIPKGALVGIIATLCLIALADVLGQYIIPGHTASIVVTGGSITALGAVLTAARGPKPPPVEPPPPADTQPWPATRPGPAPRYAEDRYDQYDDEYDDGYGDAPPRSRHGRH